MPKPHGALRGTLVVAVIHGLGLSTYEMVISISCRWPTPSSFATKSFWFLEGLVVGGVQSLPSVSTAKRTR